MEEPCRNLKKGMMPYLTSETRNNWTLLQVNTTERDTTYATDFENIKRVNCSSFMIKMSLQTIHPARDCPGCSRESRSRQWYVFRCFDNLMWLCDSLSIVYSLRQKGGDTYAEISKIYSRKSYISKAKKKKQWVEASAAKEK